MIRLALERLEVDPTAPVAWVAVDHNALSECSASSEDMEGLVEYPRRLAGVEVGLFFRGLSSERTKVSLRSNGQSDVNRVARRLGGGGHVRAAGAVLALPLADAESVTLDALRDAFREE